jgi:hypothetical protein
MRHTGREYGLLLSGRLEISVLGRHGSDPRAPQGF